MESHCADGSVGCYGTATPRAKEGKRQPHLEEMTWHRPTRTAPHSLCAHRHTDNTIQTSSSGPHWTPLQVRLVVEAGETAKKRPRLGAPRCSPSTCLRLQRNASAPAWREPSRFRARFRARGLIWHRVRWWAYRPGRFPRPCRGQPWKTSGKDMYSFRENLGGRYNEVESANVGLTQVGSGRGGGMSGVKDAPTDAKRAICSFA